LLYQLGQKGNLS